jgi:osmotically-inducible protein OsmY
VTQSAAFFVLPTHESAGEQRAGVSAAVARLMLSIEDLRMAERVEHALRATGHAPLNGIQVNVRATLVTLRGQLPTYYLKQIAQTTALAIPGVRRVNNKLTVA